MIRLRIIFIESLVFLGQSDFARNFPWDWDFFSIGVCSDIIVR
jgi:hypothetical protein